MKAVINLVTSQDGSYGLHGQTGWDDLPYWEYYDAWIVKVEVEGLLGWGPFKYRQTAKKEHKGIAKVVLYKNMLTRDKKKAEDYTITLAEELDRRGFNVEIIFTKNYKQQDLRDKIIWVDNVPPQLFQKRIEQELSSFYLYEESEEPLIKRLRPNAG